MKGENPSQPGNRELEEHPLQVDLYGIKAKGRPSPSGDPLPRSWAEVWESVKQSTMRLAVEPLALVADVLSGARSVVRGIAALPAQLGMRIAAAQQKAVDQEEERQRQIVENKSSLQIPSGAAVANLEEVLDRFQRKGIDVNVTVLPGGQILVSAIQPAHKELPQDLAQDALSEFDDKPALLSGSTVGNIGNSIEMLRLSAPVQNCLYAAKIYTIDSLVSKSRKEILNIEGMNESAMVEIEVRLKINNFGFNS